MPIPLGPVLHIFVMFTAASGREASRTSRRGSGLLPPFPAQPGNLRSTAPQALGGAAIRCSGCGFYLRQCVPFTHAARCRGGARRRLQLSSYCHQARRTLTLGGGVCSRTGRQTTWTGTSFHIPPFVSTSFEWGSAWLGPGFRVEGQAFGSVRQ